MRLKDKRTFGPQLLSPLVNKRLAPAAKHIHQLHHLLTFCREARDGFPGDNWFAGGGVVDAGEDGWAVAASSVCIVSFDSRRKHVKSGEEGRKGWRKRWRKGEREGHTPH
jgi:hypothetical protein